MGLGKSLTIPSIMSCDWLKLGALFIVRRLTTSPILTDISQFPAQPVRRRNCQAHKNRMQQGSSFPGRRRVLMKTPLDPFACELCQNSTSKYRRYAIARLRFIPQLLLCAFRAAPVRWRGRIPRLVRDVTENRVTIHCPSRSLGTLLGGNMKAGFRTETSQLTCDDSVSGIGGNMKAGFRTETY